MARSSADKSGGGKLISNWIINDVQRFLREQGLTAGELGLSPEGLADIVHLVESRAITGSTGKDLLEKAHMSRLSPSEIVEAEGLGRVSDDRALRDAARQVIESNPDQVATYRKGKATVLGWFVGQVMRQTGGKADAQRTKQILEALLAEGPPAAEK